MNQCSVDVDNKAVQIQCPTCGADLAVNPITVVRPTDACLEDLLCGELNRVCCEECDTQFVLDVPLVFRDDEARYWVSLVNGDADGGWQEAERRMTELSQTVFGTETDDDMPSCRLTLDRKAFIEKISLHMHGFDDRLIEYVKYGLLHNPSKSIDPIRSELFYDFSAQERDRLAFIIFDRETGQATAGAHIPMEVYRELADAFLTDDDLQDELDSLFPGVYVSVNRLL